MISNSLALAFVMGVLFLTACTTVSEIRTIDQGRIEVNDIPSYVNNTTINTNNENNVIIDEVGNFTSNSSIDVISPITTPISIVENQINTTNELLFGNLEVTVWDIQHEKPLYYARVSVIDAQTKFVRTTYTNSKGLAVFDSLPYAEYNVSAKKKEYESIYGYAVIDSSLKQLRLEILDDPVY